MTVASHLGIRLRDYDFQIRTFIPFYEEMLDAAARTLGAFTRTRAVILDLGTGTGALAARCLDAAPSARVIGIDSDEGILGLARKRLGSRLTAIAGDFASMSLPRCDAITASFALHHIRTRRRKAAVYRRSFAALAARGVLINADCCLASTRAIQTADRAAWRAHLERSYSRSRSEGFLRAWAKEDVYFRLDDEVDLLEAAGFIVDIPWRVNSFAVIAAYKDRKVAPNTKARRHEGTKPKHFRVNCCN